MRPVVLGRDIAFGHILRLLAPLRPRRPRQQPADDREVAAGGWAAATVAVRVNDLSTADTYRDVIEVVETVGPAVDVIVGTSTSTSTSTSTCTFAP